MLSFRKRVALGLCLPLCLSMYACSGNSGTSSTSSSASSQSEQDEINSAFEQAVEMYKATTYAQGEEIIEVSDASMWSDDVVNESYGIYKNLKKFKLEYERVYEVRKDASDKVTDDRLVKCIEKVHNTFADGISGHVVTYITGEDGYAYRSRSFEDNKTKQLAQTSYNSTDYQYPYLRPQYLSSLKSTTEGSTRTFEFEIKLNGIMGEFLDGYASKDSNVKAKHFGGRLIVDDTTGKITLEVQIELQNTETGHTFTKTHKSVCDNTTPELEFPDDLDLDSYKQVGAV